MYVLIVEDIWRWPFSAWSKRLGPLIPSVCHNSNNCKADLIQEKLMRHTMLWFRHSFVSKCTTYWTGYSLFHWIVTSECHIICKYMPSLKITIGKCLFQKNDSGNWGEKGLCETIYNLQPCCLRLTCGSECEHNILLNECVNHAYRLLAVCMWHSLKEINDTWCVFWRAKR